MVLMVAADRNDQARSCMRTRIMEATRADKCIVIEVGEDDDDA